MRVGACLAGNGRGRESPVAPDGKDVMTQNHRRIIVSSPACFFDWAPWPAPLLFGFNQRAYVPAQASGATWPRHQCPQYAGCLCRSRRRVGRVALRPGDRDLARQPAGRSQFAPRALASRGVGLRFWLTPIDPSQFPTGGLSRSIGGSAELWRTPGAGGRQPILPGRRRRSTRLTPPMADACC
jgi:hypothetical protein